MDCSREEKNNKKQQVAKVVLTALLPNMVTSTHLLMSNSFSQDIQQPEMFAVN